jgi:hypothetical protein
VLPLESETGGDEPRSKKFAERQKNWSPGPKKRKAWCSEWSRESSFQLGAFADSN